MPAREDILTAVRSHAAEGSELPDLSSFGIQYDDPLRQFSDVLAGVGGRCVPVPDAAAAHAALKEIEPYATAKKRASCVPGVGETNFDLVAVTDPHDLEDVDFAILPGELAVAENGAVWVTGRDVPHRVLYFLPQHLALVVPAVNIVHNLHEAYERISVGDAPFATFISGPSKTADIEQALVIGAHGARSLTVFLVESMP
jgi:L-lactate dehydrogenase complex protein LldG